MYKQIFLSFAMVSILLMSTVISSTSVFAAEKGNSRQLCINESVIELKYAMQKLWIEHAWWTRSVIVSRIADLADKEEVLERLLQNQEDLGNIIKPYYGEGAGNKLTELLKEHIVIAGDIIDAAKKGDQKGVDKLNQDWERNANDIVTFLSDANPYWDKEDFTEMFMKHLKLTTDEVIFRLNKDWEEDINTADINEAHLIKMGDMLTDGIVKQFPEKFQ